MIYCDNMSIIGKLNRFLGRIEVDELNSFSNMIHALWLQYVKQGWALYLYTDDVPGADIGAVFGCKEYWESVYNMSHYSHAEDVFSYIRGSGYYVSKAAIFNKEMVYYYRIVKQGGEIRIIFNMSSLIYGRSNVHIADIVFQRSSSAWEIVSSRYASEAGVNGLKSSLSECFMKIVETEKRLESPYESMKKAYPEEFHATMERPFKVMITQNGITFNDCFGI